MSTAVQMSGHGDRAGDPPWVAVGQRSSGVPPCLTCEGSVKTTLAKQLDWIMVSEYALFKRVIWETDFPFLDFLSKFEQNK